MKNYAFFDLDGTLIKIKSMMSFLEYCCDRKLVAHDFHTVLSLLAKSYKDGASREQLNIAYYRLYRGCRWDDILVAGDRWFDTLDLSDAFYSNVLERLRQHQRCGDEAVIVSGSFAACVAPMANHLGISHALTSEPDINAGRMTGELKFQAIGAGKADAMARFLKHNLADASCCYAYGDDVSDIPMLSSVGNPCVVGASCKMINEAAKRRWECIDTVCEIDA